MTRDAPPQVDAGVLGAVIAGGASRRFGSDKAMATLNGKSLIEQAIASLSPHVATVVICGRELAGRPWLPDRPGPGLGPLGGLNAALHHARDNSFSGALTIACDMPCLPSDLVDRLGRGGPSVIEDYWLIGYWPAQLADALETHLRSSNDRSMRAWIAHSNAAVVRFAGRLPNINTPADLAALA